MNTSRFFLNYKELTKILHKAKFAESELAQLAMQGAFKLEELELQNRQISIAEEKARQELEIQTTQARIANKQAIAETLKSLIQVEAMIRSVKDNAAINKANALVGFVNAYGNANHFSAISRHANGTMDTINAINTSGLNGEYDRLLSLARAEVFNYLNRNEGCKDVFIYAPRMELLINERMKILGISSYGNNPTRFFINNELQAVENTKTLLFKQEKVGTYIVKFEARQDDGTTWVGDSIAIEVREFEYKP